MSRSSIRRTAVLAVLAPVVAGGILAATGPASAIPFEGDPDPVSCVRIVALPGAAPAGSSRFVSHGYAAVLVPRIDC